MKKFLSISALVALLSCPLLAQPYVLDPNNSQVNFEISHLKLTKVDGKFDKFSANIDYDTTTKVLNLLEGSVEIASVDTANAKRDEHLNAADIFDSKKYPNMTFKMTKFEAGKIYGDLTIKNTTKPIVLQSTETLNGATLQIQASATIKRSDFGVVWESNLKNSLVGDEVKILLTLTANPQ